MLIIECPLLDEMGLRDVVDEVVLVTAKDDVRIGRMMRRDGLSEVEARARMRSQDRAGITNIVADQVIDNSSSRRHLRKEVGEVWISLMASSEDDILMI